MELVTDNAAVPEKVQWRGAESVRLPATSPRLGRKLLARTLVEAWCEGLELRRMAALAWRPGAIIELSNAAGALLAIEQGYEPDLQLEDFGDIIVGTIGNVLHDRGDDQREPITYTELDEMADAYLAMVQAANELDEHSPDDAKFLRQTRKRINTAVSLIVRAPLFDRSTFEEWALVKEPDFSMLAGVEEHYRQFKIDYDVRDVADILAAPVQPIEECALALIDQAAMIPPLGFRTLRQLLPRASFVLNA